MRWGLALALLSGCDVVLGLQRSVDAMPMLDAPLPDAREGCWTVLFQEHDEDGDGRMDGCDNCPAIANGDQGDSDGDGVGNVCDPSTGLEQIAYFRSFSAVTDIDGCDQSGDQWSIKSDALFQDKPTGTTALVLPGSFTGARVYTQVFNISTPSASATRRDVGVNISASGTSTTGVTCIGRKRFDQPSYAVLTNGGMTAFEIVSLAGIVGIDVMSRGPTGTPSCEVSATPSVVMTLTNQGPTEGRVGLVTSASTAAFLSVTVITPR